MAAAKISSPGREPMVVGSFSSAGDLRDASALSVRECCDVVEIRLDLLVAEGLDSESPPWSHLLETPLLFTARREEEGGALAMNPGARMEVLRRSLDEASWVDIEVASLHEMEGLLIELGARGLPWIASYHDFKKLPDNATLARAARVARDAGAAVFKAAAMLESPADLARLAEFQLEDHGLPVATMGMGPLAPVSRLLCAQCGSVFNYGFVGKTATAPGQWESALLKRAISKLLPLRA